MLTAFSFLVIASFTIYFITQINKRPEHVIKAAPSLLVTLGISFTFLGICWAFNEFNVSNIEQGLPALIGHIKSAFWGSFFGVSGAVIIKAFTLISTRYDAEDKTIENLLSQQASLLQSFSNTLDSRQKESLTAQLKEFMIHHNDNSKSIALWLEDTYEYIKEFTQGSNKNPWLTDATIKHNETLAALDALRTTMSNFYDQQMRKNTQIFTDAITQSIQAINSDLSKQLGSNFQKFNFGLEAMLAWQSNYKDQIDTWMSQEDDRLHKLNEFTDILENTRLIIYDTAQHLKTIGDTSSQLKDSSIHLEDSLTVITTTHQELQTGIQQTANAISKSLNELPSIKALIDAHTSMLLKQSKHVTKLNEDIQQVVQVHLEQLDDITDAQHEHITDMAEKQRELIESHNRALEAIPQAHVKVLNQLAKKQTEHLIQANDEIQRSIQGHITQLQKLTLAPPPIAMTVDDLHKSINQCTDATLLQKPNDFVTLNNVTINSKEAPEIGKLDIKLHDIQAAINRMFEKKLPLSAATVANHIIDNIHTDSLRERARGLPLAISRYYLDGSLATAGAELFSFDLADASYVFPNYNSFQDPALENWFIVCRNTSAFGISHLTRVERTSNNTIRRLVKGQINLS